MLHTDKFTIFLAAYAVAVCTAGDRTVSPCCGCIVRSFYRYMRILLLVYCESPPSPSQKVINILPNGA